MPHFEADSLDSINQLRQFGATLADLLQVQAGKIKAVELRADSNASLEGLLNALSLTYGIVKQINPNIWVIFDGQRITSKEVLLSPAQLAALWGYVDCIGLQIDHEALGTLDQRLTAARLISSNKPICVTVIGPIEQAQIITAWRGVPLLLALPLMTS